MLNPFILSQMMKALVSMDVRGRGPDVPGAVATFPALLTRAQWMLAHYNKAQTCKVTVTYALAVRWEMQSDGNAP